MQLNEQEIVRRKKLADLIAIGIDPYPAEEFAVTHTAKFINGFGLKDGEHASYIDEVTISGRLVNIMDMGKVNFAYIQDSTDRIQIYIKRDDICPDEDKTLYNTVWKKLFDIGDIIGVKGTVFATKTGEITIHVTDFKLLSKSLTPLPVQKEKDGEEFDKVNDVELMYRKRHVDLIINPDKKEIFVKIARMKNAIRQYLNELGGLEVDTPVLQSIPGGAAARPFTTHHNALNIPLYLRIANELYLKRLIVGGFDKVYEFSRNFRNEGMDRTHNPEFTVMEFYAAYKDYEWMMNETEKLLEHVAITTNNTILRGHGRNNDILVKNTLTKVGDVEIDFKAPYKRISIYDSIKEHTGIDFNEIGDEMGPFGEPEAMTIGKSLLTLEHIHFDKNIGKGKMIDLIFGSFCEHHYIQPTFIIDYPVEMSPLTKKHRTKEGLVERFELIINGKEIANAYSELNDPIDQRQRFEDQMDLMNRGDDEAMFIDNDFIDALEVGMPPTAGIGIGIDRLAMLLTGQVSIQDVLLFPQLRPKN